MNSDKVGTVLVLFFTLFFGYLFRVELLEIILKPGVFLPTLLVILFLIIVIAFNKR